MTKERHQKSKKKQKHFNSKREGESEEIEKKRRGLPFMVFLPARKRKGKTPQGKKDKDSSDLKLG